MLVELVKSKIHRVTVTEANLNYVGSITIDQDLMDAAGILPGERVQIVDNNNGARLETYTIPGGTWLGCHLPKWCSCTPCATRRYSDYHGLCLDDL